MTHEDYDAIEDDMSTSGAILAEYRAGLITEDQFYREMDRLQEAWDEEGEE